MNASKQIQILHSSQTLALKSDAKSNCSERNISYITKRDRKPFFKIDKTIGGVRYYNEVDSLSEAILIRDSLLKDIAQPFSKGVKNLLDLFDSFQLAYGGKVYVKRLIS